jgi:hypothetical protein
MDSRKTFRIYLVNKEVPVLITAESCEIDQDSLRFKNGTEVIGGISNR